MKSAADLNLNKGHSGGSSHSAIEAIERLLHFVRKYPTNAEMLKSIPG